MVWVEEVSGRGDVPCLSDEGVSVAVFFFAGVSLADESLMTVWFSDEPVPSRCPPMFCLNDDELNFLFPSKLFDE